MSVASEERRVASSSNHNVVLVPKLLKDFQLISKDRKPSVVLDLENSYLRFISDFSKGKVLMKLGRNGKLFYR
jgi:hypothetical protein